MRDWLDEILEEAMGQRLVLPKRLLKAEIIPGGLAEGRPDSDFNPTQLNAGTEVEMEHTNDRAAAREIARDHLAEDPEYYKKLKKIEKGDLFIPLAKGGPPRGGKYLRRIPTGNPKRPYRYIYAAAVSMAHRLREEAEQDKRKQAIAKLQEMVDNMTPEQREATPRLWLKSVTEAGLPDQTVNAHSRTVGKNQYGEPIREYSAERKKKHAEIIGQFYDHVPSVPQDKQPVAIVMMGGGGAGKGTIKREVLGDYSDFVNVDPDDVKNELPEYKEAKNLAQIGKIPVSARDGSWMAHEESSDVADEIRKKAMAARKNVILDGTGKNAEKYAAKIKALQDQGYHVKLLYAHVDMEEAMSRADSRADRSGRYVPEPILRDAHTRIPGNFEFVARHADEFILFASERPPKALWTGGKGMGDEILEPQAVSEFKALGVRLHAKINLTLPELPPELRKASGKPPAVTTEEVIRRIGKTWKRSEEAEEKAGPCPEGGCGKKGGMVWVEPEYEEETKRFLGK